MFMTEEALADKLYPFNNERLISPSVIVPRTNPSSTTVKHFIWIFSNLSKASKSCRFDGIKWFLYFMGKLINLIFLYAHGYSVAYMSFIGFCSALSENEFFYRFDNYFATIWPPILINAFKFFVTRNFIDCIVYFHNVKRNINGVFAP